VLPSRSPTVELIWASATLRESIFATFQLGYEGDGEILQLVGTRSQSADSGRGREDTKRDASSNQKGALTPTLSRGERESFGATRIAGEGVGGRVATFPTACYPSS